MKIFSLETKTEFRFWMLGLGLIGDFVTSWITFFCQPWEYSKGCERGFGFGWPFKAEIHLGFGTGKFFFIFVLNLLFWILVTLIILSLVKYFSNKQK